MDALSKTFKEKEIYDIILANPPFKGSIDPAVCGTTSTSGLV
jgi:23S rRNA A1618 N6-methylase RlmF